ncbi:hypothetical protein H9X57_07485 [Flavobacterium piscinae]|uniref:hypothetical protein n=1 Tax=Flavobacterium piscinae TaxID=2506424 RepID=UPI0019A902B6|nr:hypothetical protein [Flavobacterium piscinae]MBC8883322.1 hypothetical protein [Flavobacterium piscinae]
MKKILVLLFIYPFVSFSQVGVNTTNPNAMIDITSTDQGMLIPRVALLSATDNTTVVNPQGGALVTSTLVYNTTPAGVSPNDVVAGFYYWNGSRWVAVGADGRDWSITGNNGTDANTHFIGTTDNVDFRLRTNNALRFNFSNNGRLRAYDNGLATQPTFSWMGDEDTGLWRPATNVLDMSTGGVSRIRIFDTGNVGLSTTAAPARLSVLGVRNAPAFPNATSNGILRLGVSGTEGLDIGKALVADNFCGMDSIRF